MDTVDQTAALTQTAKEIEARISSEVWDKQRQWELKREALLEGARSLADFDSALMKLSASFTAIRESAEEDRPSYLSVENDALNAWNDAGHSFNRAKMIVSVVSGREVQKSFAVMGGLLKQTSAKVVDGDKTYLQTVPEIKKCLSAVIIAIRNELGLDSVAMSD